MKLSALKINSAAVEQGRWIGDLPGLPGIRFKVRGGGNVDARRLRAKLIGDVPVKERRDGLDILEGDRIDAAVMAQTILLGWDGIENEDGTPLPYSREMAEQLLNDPDFPAFRNAVSYAAGLVAEDMAEAQADAVGKSQKASAGA